MADHLMDVWDAETFDPELTARLHDQVDLITAYDARDRKIVLPMSWGAREA